MTVSLRGEVVSQGYGFLEAARPLMDSVSFAGELGKTLTPWSGGLVQQLVPKATSTPNTYSGMYGLDSFPFHTDLAHWQRPPRYLMLRCLKGYIDVPTLLIDGKTLVSEITANVLLRAVVKPRRPQRGSISLLRLYEVSSEGTRLRWDQTFLQPASKMGEVAFGKVAEWLGKEKPQYIRLKTPGDTLVVDNWRMLHARSPIPPGLEDRKIERIYLESLD